MFMKAVLAKSVRSQHSVPEQTLKEQYRDFLKRLEALTSHYTLGHLKALNPKELIKKFFNPTDSLFEVIEMIMQAIAVCCVKQSCESILESMVSMYEHHFDSTRNMGEDNVNKEFFIAVNGPNLAHCNSVIYKAINEYWKRKNWHFYRTSLSDYLKDFDGDSKVLHRLFNETSKLPCME